MKRFSGPLLAGVIVAAGSGFAGSQALAQVPGGLPPYEIMTIIRSMDFQPIEQPLRNGSTYYVRALDVDGTKMRLLIDARRGRVISATPIVEPPYGYVRVPGPNYVPVSPYGRPRYAPPPYGYRDARVISVPDREEDFDGPRVIYGMRPPAPPAVRAPRPASRPPVVRQEATPLPQPRPRLASRAPQPQAELPMGPAPSSQMDAAPPVQPLDVSPLPTVAAPPVQPLE